MTQSSSVTNAKPAPGTVLDRVPADSRVLHPRAIFRGTMVGAGGALVISTVIGVAAVLGMAGEGLSPQTIAQQLRSQWDIRLLLALAELLQYLDVLAGRHLIFVGDVRRRGDAAAIGVGTDHDCAGT